MAHRRNQKYKTRKRRRSPAPEYVLMQKVSQILLSVLVDEIRFSSKPKIRIVG